MPTLHYTDVDLIMGINYPANKQAGTFLLCKFTLPFFLASSEIETVCPFFVN